MAYYSGAAASFADLQSALTTICVGEGWTLSGSNVLSKGGVFVEITAAAQTWRLRGGTGVDGGGALTGVHAQGARMIGSGVLAVVFPASYEIFVFENEVFVVLNHSVDRYQWCAWGASVIPLPGTGMWLAATASDFVDVTGLTCGIRTNSTTQSSGLPVWAGIGGVQGDGFRINHGLDGGSWAGGSSILGMAYSASQLMNLLPNTWNNEAVLLPIRAFLSRGSSKYSLILEMQNARMTRIDNHIPGEIITLGSDKWKVFPGYRKNPAARNGGTNVDHTGTFGWVIRYEGP